MPMDKNRLGLSLLMTALTLVILCITMTAATYAWFTFDPYTNVTPMEGRISKGDTNLLISESRDGPFDKECGLNPTHLADALYPVSTQNLEAFFAATAQNRDGISTNFADVSDQPQDRLIHGTVYLQCVGGGCDVFFNKPPLDLGEDPQVLAAGRLGLKITGQNEQTNTFLLKLDDLGSTAGASTRKTVDSDDPVVVGSVDASGLPTFQEDPAQNIGSYLLDANNPTKLLTLQADEIATVEYWLYLEGCDPECYNPVQSKDIVLLLGFAGNPIAAEP